MSGCHSVQCLWEQLVEPSEVRSARLKFADQVDHTSGTFFRDQTVVAMACRSRSLGAAAKGDPARAGTVPADPVVTGRLASRVAEDEVVYSFVVDKPLRLIYQSLIWVL